MAEQEDLDSRFTRIEAALAETAEALEAAGAAAGETAGGPPDQTGALRDSEAELAAARQRIETLEQEARDRETGDREAPQGDAVARVEGPEAGGASDPSEREAELEDKLAALRAARADDLSEMKALLAELEPLVEDANA